MIHLHGRNAEILPAAAAVQKPQRSSGRRIYSSLQDAGKDAETLFRRVGADALRIII